MKISSVLLLIAAVSVTFNCFAQQDAENYPIAFDRNADRTNTARSINAVGLDDSMAPLDNKQKMYNDLTRYTLLAKAGQTVAPKIDFTGRWMLGYVYIDKDKNGQFDVRQISNNGIPSADNDLVSYAGLTLDGGEYNSLGEQADMSQVAPPPFTVPQTMTPGFYMMRYKVDWDSTDPAGRMDAANGIIKNGGGIVDIRLRIIDTDSITVAAHSVGGSLRLYNGKPLDGIQWRYGEALSLLAVPDKGYTLKSITVRHGVLTGDSISHFVAQRACQSFDKESVTDGLMTIDGTLVDGDIEINAVFVEDKDASDNSQCYALVFNDEFDMPDGSQPNSNKWRRSNRYNATWNRWISTSEDVAFIRNGALVCRAIPNKDKATDTADMLTGSVETRGLYAFTYGKVDVRLKTIPHKGSFPAAWMMPQPPTDGWPKGGEIDIFESINAQNTAYHTLHSEWIDTRGNKWNPQSSFNETVDISQWHVYSVEWEDNLITWKVDGKSVGTYRKSTSPSTLNSGQWPYNHDFYIILNQSVGDGSWAATPDLDFTYETLFDYVRVYQKVSTGIETVTLSQQPHPNNTAVYDLQGRKVANNQQAVTNGSLPRGVYIIGGKKCVVK